MSQERNCKGNVGTGWSEIAILHGLVDDLQRFGATWFLQVSSHAANGVKFRVGVTAGALLGKRVGCVLGQAAQESEGSEEVWFTNGFGGVV